MVEGRAVRSILKSRVVTGTLRLVLIGFAERNKSRPWNPGDPTAAHHIGTGHTESQCRTRGLSSVRRRRACLVTPSQTSEKRESDILGGVRRVRRVRRVLPATNRDRTPPSPFPASWAACVPPRRRGAVGKLPCLAGLLVGGGLRGGQPAPGWSSPRVLGIHDRKRLTTTSAFSRAWRRVLLS